MQNMKFGCVIFICLLFAFHHTEGKEPRPVVLYSEVLNYSDYVFCYDNIRFKDSLLVPYLLDKKIKYDSVASLPTEDFKLEKIPLYDTLTEDVSKVFAMFNAVNGWSVYLKWMKNGEVIYSSKKECTQFILETYNFYYCGRVMLSKSFDSFLIMQMPNKEHLVDREIFLVNMIDGMITSIVNLCQYHNYIGDESYTQVLRLGDNYYHREERILFCDLENENGKFYQGPMDQVDFRFDRNGRVVILQYYDDL